MHKYTYMLMQYIPDPLRGESVNVGIAFFSPDTDLIKFGTRKNLEDLRILFPQLNIKSLKEYLRKLENVFNSTAAMQEERICSEKLTIKDIAHKILHVDESAIQWGSLRGGLSNDPEATFRQLDNRFVQQSAVASTHAHFDIDSIINFLTQEVLQGVNCLYSMPTAYKEQSQGFMSWRKIFNNTGRTVNAIEGTACVGIASLATSGYYQTDDSMNDTADTPLSLYKAFDRVASASNTLHDPNMWPYNHSFTLSALQQQEKPQKKAIGTLK